MTRPGWIEWWLFVAGWIVCAASLGVAYCTGVTVGAHDVKALRQQVDSLMVGLPVTLPDGTRAWTAPRDTIRGRK